MREKTFFTVNNTLHKVPNSKALQLLYFFGKTPYNMHLTAQLDTFEEPLKSL